MSFRNRRNRTEEIESDFQPEVVEKFEDIKDNVLTLVIEKPELPKQEKEIPEWKKILQEKQQAKKDKAAQPKKEIKPTEPVKEIAIPAENKKSEDTKLALIGTTDTATTFRSIVKKQRHTITQVLDKLLTDYNKANEKFT